MKRVTIVQSFDGHAIGSVVELSDSAAESAMIQKRGVLLDDDGEVATAQKKQPAKPKARRKAPAKKKT